jgi:hypothetical protein
LSVAQHLAAGTYRRDRHGPVPGNVVAMPQLIPDWQPTAVETRDLTAQAVKLLEETLKAYRLSPIEGIHLLVALRALSRLEALEAGLAREGMMGRDGGPSSFLAAIARERRSFELAWATLRLEP